MSAQRVIIGCWLAALGIIVYSQQRSEAGVFPPAYRLGGAALTYTFLLVMAAFPPAAPLATVFSIAWTFGLAWRSTQTTAAPAGLAPATATAAQRAGAPTPKKNTSTSKAGA